MSRLAEALTLAEAYLFIQQKAIPTTIAAASIKAEFTNSALFPDSDRSTRRTTVYAKNISMAALTAAPDILTTNQNQ